MADVFYVSIEGAKQGKFKAEGAGHGTGKIPGLALHYEVTSPRDAATGMATGKRQHSPVTLVKEWGASSPQLFEAAVTNELLKSVFFEFLQTTPDGMEEVVHTIKLTNATIASIKQDVKGVGAQGTQDLEEISFVFQTIEMVSQAGKTSAADDWKGSSSKASRLVSSGESGAIIVQEPYAGLAVGAEAESFKMTAPRTLLSRLPASS